MKEISLDELPKCSDKYSDWIKILLGLKEWKKPHRDIEKIDAEYDKDKWKKCLDHYSGHLEITGVELTVDEIKQFELRNFSREPQPNPSYVSKKNKLYTLHPADARRSHEQMIRKHVGQLIERADVVVEFGCAYGYNLWMLKQAFPGKKYIGGEYSANAVRLAGKLFRDDDDIIVEHLDFNDTHYSLLDRLKELHSPCVLFTVQAVEQQPSAYHLVQTLLHYKDIIKAAVHIEPLYELNGDTTLGLMRKRYAQINDYNRDLISCLEGHRGIRMVKKKVDVFSCNPFNPIGIIEWEPVL